MCNKVISIINKLLQKSSVHMLNSVWESKREEHKVSCSLKQQLLVLCIKQLLLLLLHSFEPRFSALFRLLFVCLKCLI